MSSLRHSLTAWPGVSVVTKRSGGASFHLEKKVFAFMRPEGIAIKLPEARIQSIMRERDAVFLRMGARTMRQWVVLRFAQNATIEKRDLELLREALRFTAES